MTAKTLADFRVDHAGVLTTAADGAKSSECGSEESQRGGLRHRRWPTVVLYLAKNGNPVKGAGGGELFVDSTGCDIDLPDLVGDVVAGPEVRARGVQCAYPSLEEGYRARGSGVGLAKHLSGIHLDAVYEYLYWYLSGWIGSQVIRSGYYPAIPETATRFLRPHDWEYWIEGKAATADVLGEDGRLKAKAGTVRDGGSFSDRMGRVACWNSTMREFKHSVMGWNEFIAS